MTTTVLTKESSFDITYEPTVADKIQRIIYRLESGESLNWGQLKGWGEGSESNTLTAIAITSDHGAQVNATCDVTVNKDLFCVLGMFADESGLGYWDAKNRYVIDDGRYASSLTKDIYEYYGLTDREGSFDISDLPYGVQNKLQCLLFGTTAYSRNLLSIRFLNDYGKLVSYEYINQLLADIIRSGVIFKNREEN